MTIDAASQEEAFRTQMSKVPGAEVITDVIAESIRIGGSTYDARTRTFTHEGHRMHISSDGVIRP